jgi:hypothetical protein
MNETKICSQCGKEHNNMRIMKNGTLKPTKMCKDCLNYVKSRYQQRNSNPVEFAHESLPKIRIDGNVEQHPDKGRVLSLLIEPILREILDSGKLPCIVIIGSGSRESFDRMGNRIENKLQSIEKLCDELRIPRRLIKAFDISADKLIGKHGVEQDGIHPIQGNYFKCSHISMLKDKIRAEVKEYGKEIVPIVIHDSYGSKKEIEAGSMITSILEPQYFYGFTYPRHSSIEKSKELITQLYLRFKFQENQTYEFYGKGFPFWMFMLVHK